MAKKNKLSWEDIKAIGLNPPVVVNDPIRYPIHGVPMKERRAYNRWTRRRARNMNHKLFRNKSPKAYRAPQEEEQ